MGKAVLNHATVYFLSVIQSMEHAFALQDIQERDATNVNKVVIRVYTIMLIWFGYMSIACPNGTWGLNCANSCSLCSSNATECHPVEGCICPSGWKGDHCEICKYGTL
jgi:hypothetical protein